MDIKPVERRSNISRQEFLETYYKPNRPVILTDLVERWPARNKWTFEYLIENLGHLDVPVVGADFHKPGVKYMKAKKLMKFGDYLQLIQDGPTEYRIFLWNIFKHAPKLLNDVSNHTICDGWVDKFPFMFFGGQGAVTTLHYDIDCSHVFHTHFLTKKRIMLFPPEESAKLYKHPFTVQSRVDPMNPDYQKFPALYTATAQEAILKHGETLFMPSKWWHHIRYEEGGFSISLRSIANWRTQAEGLLNIAHHFVVDKSMNALLGSAWSAFKENTAQKRAQRIIQRAQWARQREARKVGNQQTVDG